MSVDELYDEVFVRWAAYQQLMSHLSRRDPLEADPRDFPGLVATIGPSRAGALLYAHGLAASMTDGMALVRSLVERAEEGRRPRCGLEAFGHTHDEEAG